MILTHTRHCCSFVLHLLLAIAFSGCSFLGSFDPRASNNSTSEEINEPDSIAAETVAETTAVPTKSPAMAVTDGNLAGTKAEAPADVLPAGSALAIGIPTEDGSYDEVAGLTKVNDPVDIAITDAEGNPVATLAEPMSIALNISGSGTALTTLDTDLDFENICVLLDADDGNNYVWKRNVLSISEDSSQVEFETTKVGSFQMAICDVEEVDKLFSDASTAGISGELRLWASITVQPADFPQMSAATFFCFYTSTGGNVVDGFSIPYGQDAFSAHIVTKPSLYDKSKTYKLHVLFATAKCDLTDPDLAKSPNIIGSYGPFSTTGEKLHAKPASGLLGAAEGSFPLAGLSLRIVSKKLQEDTQTGCLNVYASDTDTVLLRRGFTIKDGVFGNGTSSIKMWSNPSSTKTYDMVAAFGTNCNDNAGTNEVVFREVTSGTVISMAAVPLSIALFENVLTGEVAAAGSTDVPACIRATDGADKVFGGWNVIAEAPATTVGPDDPVPAIAETAYFPTNNNGYTLEISSGTTCDEAGAADPVLKPATTAAIVDIDIERP